VSYFTVIETICPKTNHCPTMQKSTAPGSSLLYIDYTYTFFGFFYQSTRKISKIPFKVLDAPELQVGLKMHKIKVDQLY